MKQTPEVNIRISEELLRKLIVVAETEKRTLNNQFLFMIRNNVQYFERTKGKIDPQRLKNIVLSDYIAEDISEKDEI